MNIKVQMKYLFLEGLLIELRLCHIKNNITKLISTSIDLQDGDTNPIIITITIIQISILIPQVSAGNPSCPTHSFSFKPNPVSNKVPSPNPTSIDQFSM